MESGEVTRRLHDAPLILTLDLGREGIEERVLAAIEAGVWALEVPVGEDAELLSALVRACRGCLPGAAEVANAHQAWLAVEAGARFVSASPLSAEIAAVCEAADVPVVAVVESKTDLQEALALRPALLRLQPDVALPKAHDAGLPIIMEIENTSETAATCDGSTVAALRESALTATSPEELGSQLRSVLQRLTK